MENHCPKEGVNAIDTILRAYQWCSQCFPPVAKDLGGIDKWDPDTTPLYPGCSTSQLYGYK